MHCRSFRCAKCAPVFSIDPRARSVHGCECGSRPVTETEGDRRAADGRVAHSNSRRQFPARHKPNLSLIDHPRRRTSPVVHRTRAIICASYSNVRRYRWTSNNKLATDIAVQPGRSRLASVRFVPAA